MLRTATLLCLGGLAHAALAQPGTLDPTFGTGGVVQLDITGDSDVGLDLLPLNDGRLWVCGYSTPSIGPKPFLLRLLPDGTVDPGYGIVTLSHGGNEGRAESMVYAADSSIYLCGYADTLGYHRLTLWHMLPDGTPDLAFGINGRVSIAPVASFNTRAVDISVQADGKLMLAGHRQISSSRDSYMARFNTDGTLDNSFGFGGLYHMDYGDPGTDEFLTVDVLDDGSIVAGGYGRSGVQDYPLIAKLSPAGVPDPTFDGDGLLIPTVGVPESRVTCLAAMGQMLVASGARTGLFIPSDLFLIRLDDTGVLDPSFGTLGEQLTDVDYADYSYDLLLLADGRIVVTGSITNQLTPPGYTHILAVVYTADGPPYTTFNGTGYAIGAFSTEANEGYAVKAQADGKLVICGTTNVGIGVGSMVTVVRYENDVNTQVTATALETGLLTWPNPASDHLRLNTTITGAARVEILDACGRVVRSVNIPNANGAVIPVADLQPGSYVLRCAEGEVVRTAAFVIAR